MLPRVACRIDVISLYFDILRFFGQRGGRGAIIVVLSSIAIAVPAVAVVVKG